MKKDLYWLEWGLVTPYVSEIEGTDWVWEAIICRGLFGQLRIWLEPSVALMPKGFKLLSLCIQNFFLVSRHGFVVTELHIFWWELNQFEKIVERCLQQNIFVILIQSHLIFIWTFENIVFYVIILNTKSQS